jgi:protein-L-isoaspartate(D-aspartate) O-methyltransferase
VLGALGCSNVQVRAGDGYAGWRERAPFDRILLTAAPPSIPSALVAQLADGGTIVAPSGASEEIQQFVRLRKSRGSINVEDLGPVQFVPMVHAH